MQVVKCLRVEDSDFRHLTKREIGFLKMTPELIRAEQDADLVIYRDQVLKNRAGPLGRLVPCPDPLHASA